VVRGAADALDELFGVGGADRLAAERPAPVMSDEEAAVLRAVEAGADVGSIAVEASLEPGRVRVILGTLEAAGLVRRTGIGSYQRSA
jgi:hypothetical protein